MPLAERRYDRLAVRLSLIISRLVAGETLDMQKLATEFDVSVRTLYRDFRERLIYLDLECHQGCYRLRTGAGPQGELDVLTFAHRTGIAGIWPLIQFTWEASREEAYSAESSPSTMALCT